MSADRGEFRSVPRTPPGARDIESLKLLRALEKFARENAISYSTVKRFNDGFIFMHSERFCRFKNAEHQAPKGVTKLSRWCREYTCSSSQCYGKVQSERNDLDPECANRLFPKLQGVSSPIKHQEIDIREELRLNSIEFIAALASRLGAIAENLSSLPEEDACCFCHLTFTVMDGCSCHICRKNWCYGCYMNHLDCGCKRE